MHKTPLSHASRIFLAMAALLSLLLLTGCEMTITNLTPDKVPQNPSQIYTITARFKAGSTSVAKSSIQPRIVIDGQIFPMNKSAVSEDVYEFEYQLPAGRRGATYYFICDYTANNSGSALQQQAYSEQHALTINDRYVLRPEATRAPVGARVSVLGYGFTMQDVIYLDSTPARTVFESPSSIGFFVPGVEAGKNYKLAVRGAAGELGAGTFRVDATSIQVAPSSLALRQGEPQALTFTIPMAAGAGGVLIDVTTDAPESVIMPEVVVPAGATSVTVAVQGGKPGSGSLFVKSASVGEISIPVTVSAK